jgi:hypothetical protein
VTYAPDDLLAVLRYLNTQGAPWASLGLVGDSEHVSTGGYHVGRDDLAAHGRLGYDYSVVESPRDRNPTNAAAAVDITGASWWHPFTLWLVQQAQAGTPGTEDIREIIYTPDGRTVSRWDRLGIRNTGDDSHLYHTHVSFFRDSEGRRGSFLDLVRRYFEGTTIAVPEVDDMPAFQTGQLPAGFAIDAAGRTTDETKIVMLLLPAGARAGLPWGDIWLSLGCDLGSARIRVAVHDGVAWTAHNVDVSAAGGRVSMPVSASNGDGSKVSLARMATSDTDSNSDTPVAYMIEAGVRG